ncbi:DUF433 domain-containing protein [Candidatus Uhrbacteria bacterium]|nr:DUF433 domain-containing protein [Candidatus Uhrbacteria bacterium]
MEHTKQAAIERIETNPNILLGKPVIKGTRIPVSLVLNLLAHGYTTKRVVEAYPQLTLEDVRAAIEYAAVLADFKEMVYA